VWVIGFSTYTCLPSDIAAIAAGKCMWSGVEMVTASILLPSRSNIFR